MDTIQLVKQLAIKEEPTQIDSHASRIETIIGRRIIPRTVADSIFGRETRALGFYWFVDTRFALKFKYHASLLRHCVTKGNGSKYKASGGSNLIYEYAGDVPEFVLDNIERIQKAGCHPYISVHSFGPLPIVIEKIPRQIDPVAIWWQNFPGINKTCWGWEANKVQGVIIGVWDRDKEIKIF